MKKFGRNKRGPRPPLGRHVDEDGDAVMDGTTSKKDGPRHGGPNHNRAGGDTSRGRFSSLVNRMKPQINRKARFACNFDSNRAIQIHRGAGTEPWFRVLIPSGRRWGQDFILRELTAKCPVQFRAMNFHTDQQCATFYVNSYRASQEFRKLSGTITTTEGTKMNIIVRSCDLPQVSLTEFAETSIKVAMSNRYDTNTRFLNLSKFEADTSLVEAGLFLPLSRVNVANFVVTVITDHIPELEGLDFSNNQMYNINCLAPLAVKCKELKTLKLAGNKVRNVKDLDALKGLPITEATFAGCPFTERYKEEDAYVTAIRERFPRVVILDQKHLPPPIVFDLQEEKIAVPRSLPSHLPADATRQLVVGFVEQFFAVMDSDDRSPLINAYHEAALFSLSSTTLCNSRTGKDREKLDYKGDSRNFLRMQHDEDLKRRLLRQGRINIIDCLKNFAKTQHDPSSFVVDVVFVESTLMVFCVNGVFREKRPDGRFLPNLRSFQRTFTVVPQGAGLAIINDMWFITVATDKQSRAYQEPSPPSRPPSPAATTSVVAPTPVAVNNEEIIIKFMQVTKMNRRFSMDCLAQNNWNPEAAYNVFQLLEQNNKLPPEAFV